MNRKQVVGIAIGVVILVIGLYLVNSGHHSKGGTREKIKHKITGNYSKGVQHHMRMGFGLIVVGVVVGGAFAYILRSKKHHH
jgi:cell division protein FtsN